MLLKTPRASGPQWVISAPELVKRREGPLQGMERDIRDSKVTGHSEPFFRTSSGPLAGLLEPCFAKKLQKVTKSNSGTKFLFGRYIGNSVVV